MKWPRVGTARAGMAPAAFGSIVIAWAFSVASELDRRKFRLLIEACNGAMSDATAAARAGSNHAGAPPPTGAPGAGAAASRARRRFPPTLLITSPLEAFLLTRSFRTAEKCVRGGAQRPATRTAAHSIPTHQPQLRPGHLRLPLLRTTGLMELSTWLQVQKVRISRNCKIMSPTVYIFRIGGRCR